MQAGGSAPKACSSANIKIEQPAPFPCPKQRIHAHCMSILQACTQSPFPVFLVSLPFCRQLHKVTNKALARPAGLSWQSMIQRCVSKGALACRLDNKHCDETPRHPMQCNLRLVCTERAGIMVRCEVDPE